MVSFKFTKQNGVACVGAVKKVPTSLANVYVKLGIGFIVEEVKEKKKSTKKK